MKRKRDSGLRRYGTDIIPPYLEDAEDVRSGVHENAPQAVARRASDAFTHRTARGTARAQGSCSRVGAGQGGGRGGAALVELQVHVRVHARELRQVLARELERVHHLQPLVALPVRVAVVVHVQHPSTERVRTILEFKAVGTAATGFAARVCRVAGASARESPTLSRAAECVEVGFSPCGRG